MESQNDPEVHYFPKPDAVARPYSEWMIYYQLERYYIQQTILKVPADFECMFSPDDESYPGPLLPRRYGGVVFPEQFYTIYKDNKKAKLQDKHNHALISLDDLSSMVEKNWQSADDETKAYVLVMHCIEMDEYKRRRAEYDKADADYDYDYDRCIKGIKFKGTDALETGKTGELNTTNDTISASQFNKMSVQNKIQLMKQMNGADSAKRRMAELFENANKRLKFPHEQDHSSKIMIPKTYAGISSSPPVPNNTILAATGSISNPSPLHLLSNASMAASALHLNQLLNAEIVARQGNKPLLATQNMAASHQGHEYNLNHTNTMEANKIVPTERACAINTIRTPSHSTQGDRLALQRLEHNIDTLPQKNNPFMSFQTSMLAAARGQHKPEMLEKMNARMRNGEALERVSVENSNTSQNGRAGRASSVDNTSQHGSVASMKGPMKTSPPQPFHTSENQYSVNSLLKTILASKGQAVHSVLIAAAMDGSSHTASSGSYQAPRDGAGPISRSSSPGASAISTSNQPGQGKMGHGELPLATPLIEQILASKREAPLMGPAMAALDSSLRTASSGPHHHSRIQVGSVSRSSSSGTRGISMSNQQGGFIKLDAMKRVNDEFSLSEEEMGLLLQQGAKSIAESAAQALKNLGAQPSPDKTIAAIKYLELQQKFKVPPKKDSETSSCNGPNSGDLSKDSSGDNPPFELDIAMVAAAATAMGLQLLPPSSDANDEDLNGKAAVTGQKYGASTDQVKKSDAFLTAMSDAALQTLRISFASESNRHGNSELQVQQSLSRMVENQHTMNDKHQTLAKNIASEVAQRMPSGPSANVNEDGTGNSSVDRNREIGTGWLNNGLNALFPAAATSNSGVAAGSELSQEVMAEVEDLLQILSGTNAEKVEKLRAIKLLLKNKIT